MVTAENPELPVQVNVSSCESLILAGMFVGTTGSGNVNDQVKRSHVRSARAVCNRERSGFNIHSRFGGERGVKKACGKCGDGLRTAGRVKHQLLTGIQKALHNRIDRIQRAGESLIGQATAD